MAPVATAASAIVAFTLLLLAPLASAECRLPLTLNPELSLLTLGGGVVAPAQPLSLVHPEAAVGLRGALSWVFAGACPADAAGLVSSLAGSRLETSAELGPLLLYPELVQAVAGSLAGVSLSGVAVNLSTTPLLDAAGQGGTFSSTLDATLAGGTASLNASLLSPDPVPIVLLGLTASNATQVVASEQGGLARLQLQGLQLTFPYTLEVPGLPLKLSLEVVLNGTLVLETALGCLAECGAHGRCWVGGAGSTSTATAAQTAQPAVPVCECECGWTGAGCAVPSGFCPLYPSQARLLAVGQAAATCPVVAATSPATSAALGTPQQCPACITPDDCTGHQTYDSATRACVCRPGWVGKECSACRTADACNAFYGVTGSTCSQQDFTFNPQSQLKVYSCELQGLETLLRPAFTVSCNTSQPEAGDDKSGRYCQFDMSTAEGIPMTCVMSGCSFQPGSTRIDCTNVHCECASACPEFQPLINLAEGQPVVIDCNPSTQICTTDIMDFLVVLPASCETAECLVEGYRLEGGSNVVQSGQDYNVIIAAIPLMALVAATCACAFLLARHWPYWAALGSSPLPGGEQALAGGEQALLTGQVHVRMRAGANPEELRFSQLSCSVPAQSSQRGTNAARYPSANGAGKAGNAEAPPARRWYNFWGGGSGRGGVGGAGMKPVLRGVSGVARKGDLVAVMGPSGCGKTTLLALLAGSAEYLSDGAQVEGAVMLDGVPMGSGASHKVAFVPQDDTLPSTLTVAECLTTHAMLRLPTWLTPTQVQAQVWRVITELGLQQVAGSRVGGGLNGGRGLSGGERRRVTIGQELVSDPAILVLDEPTSGLDAYSALQLIRTLKQVASAGRIVLLSCHQPSPAMFNLIDRAYLLVAGTCVFGGPPAAVGAHFASHGLPCPPNTAAAEHMLEVVSDPHLLPQLLQSMQRSSHLNSAGSEHGCAKLDPASSALPGEAVLHVLTPGGSPGVVLPQAGSAPLAATPPEKPLDGIDNGPHNLGAGGEPAKQAHLSKAAPKPARDQSVHSAGCHGTSRLARELAVVFGRTLADTLRNPSLLLLHWVLALAMGLLMGAIFWQVSLDMSGVQNRGGGVYFTLAFFAFTALTTTDVLTAERRLVMREVRGGYCRPLTYLLAKAMLDGLLLRVIPVFLYSVPFYYMMGLQTGATHVALFLFTVATFALAVAALSLAVAAACTTAGQASLLLTFIFLLSLLVGGFLVNVDSIPDWISWLRYLSIFYYSYGILTTNEVAGLRMEIAVEGYTAVADVRGLAVLSTFGIDASRLTTWIVVLDCLYAACLILALAMLYLRMRRPAALRRQKGPGKHMKAGGAQPASGPDDTASLGV